MLISVLLPFFNAEDYIIETLDSVAGMAYPAMEIIAINDNSVDSSLHKVLNYPDSRVRCFNNKGKGLVDALNTGISYCSGDWIARIDADDLCLKNRLLIQKKAIKPGVVVIGGNAEIIDKGGVRRNITSLPCDATAIISALERGKSSLLHPSVLLNRKALMKVGGYRKEFVHAEDVDLWLRLSKIGEIINVPDTVIKLRKHDSNISVLRSNEQLLSGLLARIYSITAIDLQRIDEISEFVLKSKYYRNIATYRSYRNLKKGICLTFISRQFVDVFLGYIYSRNYKYVSKKIINEISANQL